MGSLPQTAGQPTGGAATAAPFAAWLSVRGGVNGKAATSGWREGGHWLWALGGDLRLPTLADNCFSGWWAGWRFMACSCRQQAGLAAPMGDWWVVWSLAFPRASGGWFGPWHSPGRVVGSLALSTRPG